MSDEEEVLKCLYCGIWKLKCDGVRPAPCSRCSRSAQTCSYDEMVYAGIFDLFPPSSNLSGKISIQPDEIPLDAGGFGAVFKTCMTTGHLVAVKVFFKDQRPPARTLQLSVREALMWKTLVHPNIVPLLGIADFREVCPTAQSQLCLVSPWMNGGNIMHFIKANPSINRMPLLLHVVHAVRYLHQFPSGPIVHGDLKGANILIEVKHTGPVARLIDFGLSGLLQSATHDTATITSTASAGSRPWMAVERMMSDSPTGARSIQSDIFEMMRAFYEILTGQRPFPKDDVVQIIVKVTQGIMPDRPVDYCHGIDEPRWNLMKQAWSMDPLARPTLDIVQEDIEQSINTQDLLFCSPDLSWEQLANDGIDLERLEHEREHVISSSSSGSSSSGRTLPESPTSPRLDRIGCLSCGIWRFECDGNRPSCGRCHRQGRQCSYDWTIGVHLFQHFPDLSEKIVLKWNDRPMTQGSSGVIYKTRMSSGEVVAVKVPHTGRYWHGRALQLFMREASLWHSLSHENITPLLGVADHQSICEGSPSQLCLVSEWMKGGTVMQYISENPRVNRIPFLLDITNALIYLHTLSSGPIIHGSLRGSHVLIDLNQQPARARLANFGLAEIYPDQTVVPHQSMRLLKVARWVAFERLMYQAHEKTTPAPGVSLQSDVFELARTCFEILTGAEPFYEDNDQIAASKVSRGENPARIHCSGLDDDMWAWMSQAWAIEPEVRPSLGTIKEHLEESLDFYDTLNQDVVDLALLIRRSTSWSRVMHERAHLNAVKISLPFEVTPVNHNPVQILSRSIKKMHVRALPSSVLPDLAEILNCTPDLQYLLIEGSEESDLWNEGWLSTLDVIRQHSSALRTLRLRRVPLFVRTEAPWNLRSLEICIQSSTLQHSPHWSNGGFPDWCRMLMYTPGLTQLVIQHAADDDKAWSEAYTYLTSGAISATPEDLQMPSISLPHLRFLQLQTAHPYVTLVLTEIIEAPRVRDLSLGIPWANRYKNRQERKHLYARVGERWTSLRVLRLPGLVQDSDIVELLAPFGALKILECTANMVDVLCAEDELLPRLKTLRLSPSSFFPPSEAFQLLVDLLDIRESLGYPLDRLLFDLSTDLSASSELEGISEFSTTIGWYAPRFGFPDLEEELEPDRGWLDLRDQSLSEAITAARARYAHL